MLRNSALEKMRADELALGVLLRQARTGDIAGAMAACGLDWLFLDLEHGSMTSDTAAQISVAALACGIAPIVRTPIMDLGCATKAMDNGALGIIMPRIETVLQAQTVAKALRYPPMGHRGVIGMLPHFNFQPPPLAEATREMDHANLIALLIETPLGVQNIEAIAAVEGIDLLLIGSNDLSLEMGIHGQFHHPEFDASLRKVIAAGLRNKKFVGLGGIDDSTLIGKYVELGVRFIQSGADISLLMSAAAQRSAELRKLHSSREPR
jgi:4-hydroxy-2-oxoheptanedioate aldolase